MLPPPPDLHPLHSGRRQIAYANARKVFDKFPRTSSFVGDALINIVAEVRLEGSNKAVTLFREMQASLVNFPAQMPEKSISSGTSLIDGLPKHGHRKKAVSFLTLAFIGVLTAFCHIGMMDKRMTLLT